MKMSDKVKQDPSILMNLSTPSVDLQRIAVTKDPLSIRWIKNPRAEIQAIAVLNGGAPAYRLIESPCHLAKKALITISPRSVLLIGKDDEQLVEHAIMSQPDIISVLPVQPYRLQAMALSRVSRPMEFIGKIPGLHIDLLREHLSRYPKEYGKFEYIPLDVELSIINKEQYPSHLITAFLRIKNPSKPCQNLYYKMITALADKYDFDLRPSSWWTGLTDKLDMEFKYDLFERICQDDLKHVKYHMDALRTILAGTPFLSALTLMI